MSNDPVICANYSGLSRCLLGVGQGMMFGIDASGVAFDQEAAAMLTLFTSSILGFLVFTYFCMEETRYFKEDHVIVPVYAQEKLGHIINAVTTSELRNADEPKDKTTPEATPTEYKELK